MKFLVVLTENIFFNLEIPEFCFVLVTLNFAQGLFLAMYLRITPRGFGCLYRT